MSWVDSGTGVYGVFAHYLSILHSAEPEVLIACTLDSGSSGCRISTPRISPYRGGTLGTTPLFRTVNHRRVVIMGGILPPEFAMEGSRPNADTGRNVITVHQVNTPLA